MTLPDWEPSKLQGSQHSYERLMGAIAGADAGAAVLEDARRALVEARFLLVSEGGSTLEQREQAVAVLERGIRDAEYALNITEREPRPLGAHPTRFKESETDD